MRHFNVFHTCEIFSNASEESVEIYWFSVKIEPLFYLSGSILTESWYLLRISRFLRIKVKSDSQQNYVYILSERWP